MRRLKTVTTATVVMAALVVSTAGPARAQALAAFERNLTEHVLDNGITVLIYERPTAPVVSFFTLVDVGGAREVPGITGIAHMFEHMAFKGTTTIGTTNHKAEVKAMAAVDEAFAAYELERNKFGGGDPEKIEELVKAWKDVQEAAGEFVVNNEFGEIIDRAGGVGLNAFTGSDVTGYVYSLPANKVELWAYLESERFIDPVFREFYKERDVVMEERRLSENQPIGRLLSQGLAVQGAAVFRSRVLDPIEPVLMKKDGVAPRDRSPLQNNVGVTAPPTNDLLPRRNLHLFLDAERISNDQPTHFDSLFALR